MLELVSGYCQEPGQVVPKSPFLTGHLQPPLHPNQGKSPGKTKDALLLVGALLRHTQQLLATVVSLQL